LPATQRFVEVKTQIDPNTWGESTTWFDGLGRTKKIVTSDSQGDVIVETEYDLMGRPYLVTNPYRAGDTVYWNRTKYDELGRAVQSFAPALWADASASLPNSNLVSLGTTSFGISTVTNYVGTFITSDDASGRKGRSITNALGQLLRVDEPIAMGGTADGDLGAIGSPAQPTYYKYDLYGNMVRVTQGVQNRFFKYDSLGRLIRVRQPEQEINDALDTAGNPDNNDWTAGFTYDVLGNVLTATDAKNITIYNTYDRAGRVALRDYSDSTPEVYFYYDGKGLAPGTPMGFAKGKLTVVDSSVSQTSYKLFDNFGRLKEMEQRTPIGTEAPWEAEARISKYTYNLSGALIEEEYPSGMKVKNEFESDGDLKRIFGNATSTAAEQTYANSFSYTPDGRIEKLKLGNGLWESAKFNTRLQVTELALGHSVGDGNLWKLNYEYGELVVNGSNVSVDTNKDTGNLARQTINFYGLSHPFVQTYKYDPLYRLTEARETKNENQTWKQTFGYDRYGNRTAFTQEVGGQNLTINNLTLPVVDTNTNRFQTNPSQGYGYDKNGNITADPASNGRQFVFNGDNKQIEVKDANGSPIGKYYYDGEGKRVKKVVYPGTSNEETTVFVYSSGKLVAEYSTAQAPLNPNIHYTATDRLGSPRVLTGKYGEIISRRDFMPFGEELYADTSHRTTANKYTLSGEDAVRKRFTGYEKDKETGLDFAEARYYNNQHARFTAVDPLLASGKSANPQTFNRYVYVMNRPLRFTDKSGLQAGDEAEDGGLLGTIYTYLKWVTRTDCWNGNCVKTRERVEGGFDDIDPVINRLRAAQPGNPMRMMQDPEGHLEFRKKSRNVYLSSISPTFVAPDGYMPNGTPEQVERTANIISTIDQTGTFDLAWSGYRNSTGKVSNSEYAGTMALTALNFVPGGKGGKGFNLALGLTDNIKEFFDFAKATKSTTYFQRAKTTLFVPEKFENMAKEAKVINFNLKGFSFSQYADWIKAGRPEVRGSATNQELFFVLSRPEIRIKTNFFTQ
jgi:RHS repeat-associated protein